MELYLRGDQLATFEFLSSGGNANGTQVSLFGVRTLGSSEDTFRVVVRQAANNQTAFQNGQMVDIYRFPDTIGGPSPLYANLNPQHDQFNGRASSDSHNIFSGGRLLIQTAPISNGTIQYGPGSNPPRSEQLSFSSFAQSPPIVPCFTPGTLIQTDKGAIPVERLAAGDRVLTMDAGHQPVRWIGQRTVQGTGALSPVTIAKGALGNDRTLQVSPQHRILVTDARGELWFGSSQFLVAAKHLVNGTTITRRPQSSVTYVHFALDKHHIVFSDGLASESLFLGRVGVASVNYEHREELLSIFPELMDPIRQSKTARPCLVRWEAMLLTENSR